MSMNKQRSTSNINNVILYDDLGNITIPQIANATTDTDKFIVSDGGVIKYRTGNELLVDLSAQGAITLTTNNTTGAATLIGNTLNIPLYSSGPIVPQSRTLSINGTSYDLTANRSWSVGTITDLTGEVTASGSGSVSATISNTAVLAKTLAGLTITVSSITSSDTIISAMGKLQGQINTLTGSLIYKGSWNASTNTPTITSGVGTNGNFYIVTTAGSTTINGISSWAVGDWIIFNGTVWQKVPTTNSVISVNTYTGAVVLTTTDISEGTNLYYTDGRARASITGGASTIVTSNLTVNRALVSDASGKVAVSSVTSTELGYVSGVTSAIQTQLGGKEPTISAGTTAQYWRGDKTWQTLPTYSFNGLSPLTTLGDTLYHDGSNNLRLAGNTTSTRKFLRQTGNGTVSAAPAWDTLASGDIPNNAANTSGSAGSVTNSVTFNNAGTGDASGTTFNGSAAKTISYNTIGAQVAGSYQAQLNGTGFVKANGTTISYDNSTYLTTASAAATYLTISNASSTYQPIGSYITGVCSTGYYPVMSGSSTSQITSSSLQEVSGLTRNTNSGFITGVNNGYWFGTSTTAILGMYAPLANTLSLMTSSVDRVYINSSGRVMINSTTDAGASYQFQVNGSVYASAYYESSDIRKKNVIEYNPTVMMDVDVIKFTRIGSDDIRYGYSAQQVMEIAPDLVSADAELGVKYIDVHTLKIAALEKEIKELKAKLDN